MGWTTIGLLAGFLICMIGGMSCYKDNRCPLQWRIYRIDLWFLWRYFISVPDRTTSFNWLCPFTGFHCFPDISQCQDSCPVINRTAVFLSKSYIQNHHQRESYRKENSSNVGVFSGRHFGYEFFYYYIEHSSGCEA